MIINAETGERVDVLTDRTADTLESWLRQHPGVEVVCRDGSGAYAEAIRRGLPDAIQVGDRWHIWHNLAEVVIKEVAAHSSCWGKTGPPPREGIQAQTTRERWQQVHDLLDAGVGLLECARRLNLALNTVKRYARVSEPQRLVRAPKYRPTLVDPYRDHLRHRREADPAVPVQRLFEEITQLGYTGSTATSLKAASSPTVRQSLRGAWPVTCLPGQTGSPTTSGNGSTPRWPPAPR